MTIHISSFIMALNPPAPSPFSETEVTKVLQYKETPTASNVDHNGTNMNVRRLSDSPDAMFWLRQVKSTAQMIINCKSSSLACICQGSED